MKTIYLFDKNKIDYAFLRGLDTIEFTFYVNYPIVSDVLMMDIGTVLKLKKVIDEMLELRKKKEEQIKKRDERLKFLNKSGLKHRAEKTKKD